MYHPYRLHVLATCRWYQGVVLFVRHESDGDYHVVLKPAVGYGRFLDTDNYSEQHGGLVTEIMPGQSFPIPYDGEQLRMLGTWVLDADHGWNEIHPIWAIRYLDTGQMVRSIPPKKPRYDSGGGSGGGGGGRGGGGNCDPNYRVIGGPCLKDGIGDYDCYGGDGNGPNYTPPGATIKVVGTDVFGLDANHDGIACN